MGCIYRTTSAMIIACQFVISTGTEVDDAHFCKDSQIDLSRLDSNKVIRGSIYSPNFPQLYYGDSNCTIRISGLHSDHLITISHRKEDLLGPCIENFKISNNQTTNECSDLQIIYRHANSLNGLDINLDVSEMAQPGFTLSFAIHPLFYLQSKSANSTIDTKRWPEGYIAGDIDMDTDVTQIKLENFPPTAIISFEIRLTSYLSSRPATIRILTGLDDQVKWLTSSTEVSYALRERDQFLKILARYTNILSMIKYSVKHCNYTLENLMMIKEAQQNPALNTSHFVATCNDGYKTKGDHDGHFVCDDGTWKPNLQCVPLPHQDHERSQPNERFKEKMEHSSSSLAPTQDQIDNQQSTSSVLGASLGVTVTIVFILIGIYMKRSLYGGRLQKQLLRNNQQPECISTTNRPLPDEPETQSSSTYDVIDELDPYSGYWNIDEDNMLPNNTTKEYKQPVTNPTYAAHLSIKCHSGNPTTRCQSSNRVADSSDVPTLDNELGRNSRGTSVYRKLWDAGRPEETPAGTNHSVDGERENRYCDKSLQYEACQELNISTIMAEVHHNGSDSFNSQSIRVEGRYSDLSSPSSSTIITNNSTLNADTDLSRLFDEYTIPDKVDDNHVYGKIRPSPKTL